jgi:hypothetical protein
MSKEVKYSTNYAEYCVIIRRKNKEKLIDRLEYCRAMLHLHGFLSDKEDAKISKIFHNIHMNTTQR